MSGLEKARLGSGFPCFLAAEIGINHNGSLDLARRSVEAAARAGATAVKFQNYRTADFLSDHTASYSYHSRGQTITESQWEMFTRCEPPTAWWPELKRLCDELGVVFFSTPTSADGVAELVRIGSALIKNGSDYLTHLPLLELMGSTGVPVVASTGMADAADVDAAVAAVRRGARSELVLLHCTSAYPTPLDQVNLRRMLSLGQRYAVPVGFSDHTVGFDAAVQAVTLGACMIEKHFTLDHELPGPDHWFSSTPAEFAALVQAVRNAESRLGQAQIAPAAVEALACREYRLGLVAACDLAAGSRFALADAAFRRPAHGLLPRDADRYYGRVLRAAVARGTPLFDSDFEPL